MGSNPIVSTTTIVSTTHGELVRAVQKGLTSRFDGFGPFLLPLRAGTARTAGDRRRFRRRAEAEGLGATDHDVPPRPAG
ncbi:MAG: hypothetical protein M3O70_21110 [Actinomycetota bacterium]|nr:hypothetical protein [Actinomycetota bacterium]